MRIPAGFLLSIALAAPVFAREVAFTQPSGPVEAYDFLEVTVRVSNPDVSGRSNRGGRLLRLV